MVGLFGVFDGEASPLDPLNFLRLQHTSTFRSNLEPIERLDSPNLTFHLLMCLRYSALLETLPECLCLVFEIAKPCQCSSNLQYLSAGHGGPNAASFVKETLFESLLANKKFGNGNVEEALSRSFSYC